MKRTDKGAIYINAPISIVYGAFRSAEAIESWLPPNGMRGEMLAFDFTEGGSYRMRLSYEELSNQQGKTTDNTDVVEAKFTKLVENKTIEQSVVFESEYVEFMGIMKIIWDFLKTDTGTQVFVTFEDVPVGIRKEDHEAGISASLENLARYCETNWHI